MANLHWILGSRNSFWDHVTNELSPFSIGHPNSPNKAKQVSVHILSLMQKRAFEMELRLFCIDMAYYNYYEHMLFLNIHPPSHPFIHPSINPHITFIHIAENFLAYLSSHDAISTVEVVVIHVHRASLALAAASPTTCGTSLESSTVDHPKRDIP